MLGTRSHMPKYCTRWWRNYKHGLTTTTLILNWPTYWLPKYILLRGTRKISSFPYLSMEMRKVAASQDLIPWTCFMEGKLSKEIFLLQRHTLACSPSRLTIADWSRHLISQVLQMSHAQWVFRNVSLHDAAQGYIPKHSLCMGHLQHL